MVEGTIQSTSYMNHTKHRRITLAMNPHVGMNCLFHSKKTLANVKVHASVFVYEASIAICDVVIAADDMVELH